MRVPQYFLIRVRRVLGKISILVEASKFLSLIVWVLVSSLRTMYFILKEEKI